MIALRAVPPGLAAPLAAPAAVLWLGLWLAMACAGPASALSAQGSLGDILGRAPRDDRRAPPPPVARYISDEGETFVLDRTISTPLMKFQESQEVIVLRPSQAARGDVIYRDDLGQPVLRETKLGGLTLFARGRPGGAPVAVSGQAPSLRLQALSANALLQRLTLASARATRAAGRLIVFDADEVTSGSEAVFADAASVAAEAVMHISKRREAKTVLARFNRILFRPGTRSSVEMERGAMRITVVPSQGLAGRPSSARIVAAATGGK